ncbi:hypothetical protein VTJ83DRAFT_4447 [Remersonia thermophila]|uniref:Uncharacterized protein n=1 Tax=Remersonia thermophila TaxID=72144 RepID=A0ABR4DA17_9PEZI
MRPFAQGLPSVVALALWAATTTSSPTPSAGVDCRSTPCTRLTWGSCEGRGFNTWNNTDLVCSSLEVPLDYTSTSSNKTLTLELARMPARTQPARGSIQLNFGGPGAPSRENLALLGDLLLDVSGGEFDLVVFDPRGTGNTLPFNCYGDARDDPERYIKAMLLRETGNASDASAGRLWAAGRVSADDCKKHMGETGEFVGTSFVARDIVKVAEALGGKDAGRVRFWGFSYGSVLGTVLAAMFPDRIESMVLDGLVNTHEYFNGWDTSLFDDTDAVLAGVFESCFYRANHAEEPYPCPFATEYPSPAAAQEAFLAFLDNDLRYNPIAAGPYLIEYSAVKWDVFSSLYVPPAWRFLLEDMHALMKRNVTALLEGEEDYDWSAARALGDYKRRAEEGTYVDDRTTGIRCADKLAGLRLASLEEAAPALARVHAKSRFAGELLLPFINRCAHWGMPAKEHVNPLQVGGPPLKTRNRILLIGNSYDPVTPISSAFNVSLGLKGSVVLRHNGYGHLSMIEPSLCTAKAVLEYFNNGTLPEPGTVCEPENPILPGPRWEGPGVVRRSARHGDEDASLLQAWQKAGEILMGRLGRGLLG